MIAHLDFRQPTRHISRPKDERVDPARVPRVDAGAGERVRFDARGDDAVYRDERFEGGCAGGSGEGVRDEEAEEVLLLCQLPSSPTIRARHARFMGQGHTHVSLQLDFSCHDASFGERPIEHRGKELSPRIVGTAVAILILISVLVMVLSLILVHAPDPA